MTNDDLYSASYSASSGEKGPEPYAAALIRLLQGVVDSDDRATWDLVLRYQSPIRDYFARIGVELYLNEPDGFACLTQPESEDNSGSPIFLPRLTRRVKLSYEVTLILVLLHEQLNQFDSTNLEALHLVITASELFDLIRPYYRQVDDQRALFREIQRDINKVVDLGFLKEVTQDNSLEYRVSPVLKSRVPSDVLVQLKNQLEQYTHDESDQS